MKYKILMLFAGLLAVFCIGQAHASALSVAPSVSGRSSGVTIMMNVNTFAAQDPVVKKIQSSWPWYLARASGLVAAVLLVVLLISGIGMITGGTFKLLEPLVAWAAHKAVGIAFGVAVLVHVFSLLFDKFIGFNFFDLLVPFISNYKPVTIGGHHLGSLYVALGTFALYLVIAIIVTSLLIVEKKPRPWKFVHYSSYTLLALTFVHGLFLGTDLSKGIFRIMWIVGGVILLPPLLKRLWRSNTLSAKK